MQRSSRVFANVSQSKVSNIPSFPSPGRIKTLTVGSETDCLTGLIGTDKPAFLKAVHTL